jgi:hypothetical protein
MICFPANIIKFFEVVTRNAILPLEDTEGADLTTDGTRKNTDVQKDPGDLTAKHAKYTNGNETEIEQRRNQGTKTDRKQTKN